MSRPRRLLWNFVSTRSLLPVGMEVLVGVKRWVGVGIGVKVLVDVGVVVVVRVAVAVLASTVGVDEVVELGLGIMVAVGVESGNRTEQPLINNSERNTEM